MNKLVILFVIAFAYVHAEGESSSEEDLKNLANVVEKKLNSTIINDLIAFSAKITERCPLIEQKMDETMDEVSNCLDSIESGDQTFCSLLKNNFERCIQPVTKLWDKCVPEESKGIPHMTIKIINSILVQICGSTVEEMLELFNPCIFEKSFTSFPACTQLKDVLVSHKNKLPSKSLMCSTLPKLDSCFTSHREASCKNPVTKTAGINFYKAIDHSIEADCQILNETK